MLYAHNRDVDLENETNLNALLGPSEMFFAKDSVVVDIGAPDWCRERMLKDPFFKTALVPDRVVLRVGAQVMLTKNIDLELVNWSRGVIKYFATLEIHAIPPTKSCPMVLFCNGTTMLCSPLLFEHTLYLMGKLVRQQVPLELCYAITVHKSQGSSIDLVRVDLTGCFSEGQAYVALSRAKTTGTAGLQSIGFADGIVLANPMAVGFHDALTAGKLDEFFKTVPCWFAPVLTKPEIDPNKPEIDPNRKPSNARAPLSSSWHR